jgi:CRP-like cAMP-binding protein
MTESFNLTVFHPFLNGIGVDALARLSRAPRRATSRPVRASSMKAEPPTGFWLIVAGHVQLDAYLPGRGFVLIESMGAGSVLGWSWLFPPYAWYFGATAVASTSTVEFDAPGVRAMCEADPALGFELTRRFMRVVVDRLQATRIRLLDLYRSP